MYVYAQQWRCRIGAEFTRLHFAAEKTSGMNCRCHVPVRFKIVDCLKHVAFTRPRGGRAPLLQSSIKGQNGFSIFALKPTLRIWRIKIKPKTSNPPIMMRPLSPPMYSCTRADFVWVISLVISQAMLAVEWAMATDQTLAVQIRRKP